MKSLIKAQDQHLKDAVKAGDTSHEQRNNEMRGRWKRPKKSLDWYFGVEKAFAALPESPARGIFATSWWESGGTRGVDNAFVHQHDPGIGAEIMGAGKYGCPGPDPAWTRRAALGRTRGS